MFYDLTKLSDEEFSNFMKDNMEILDWSIAFLKSRFNIPLTNLTEQLEDILFVEIFSVDDYKLIKLLLFHNNRETNKTRLSFRINVIIPETISTDRFEVQKALTKALTYLLPIIRGEFYDKNKL